MKVRIKRANKTKEIPTGFSWKSLFFGVLYPLFIGDLTGFFLQLVISILTCGLSWLVTPFYYNENRLNRFMRNGWEIVY